MRRVLILRAAVAIPLFSLLAASCDRSTEQSADRPAQPRFRTYESATFKVRVTIPADWTQETGYSDRWGRGMGFIQFDATASQPIENVDIRERCKRELAFPGESYGPRPTMTMLVLDGQPACRIASAAPAKAEAKTPVGYLALYPTPVSIPIRGPGGNAVEEHRYPHLLIWIDRAHAPLVERSLRFVR